MISLKESKKGLTFDIQVIPHASRAEITGEQDGVVKIKVTAPPVEGAANEACIKITGKRTGTEKKPDGDMLRFKISKKNSYD